MTQVSAAWKETDELGSSGNYDAESIASTGRYALPTCIEVLLLEISHVS